MNCIEGQQDAERQASKLAEKVEESAHKIAAITASAVLAYGIFSGLGPYEAAVDAFVAMFATFLTAAVVVWNA